MAVSEVTEVEYVDECPSCGARFVGMTPDEYRENHECGGSPFIGLLVFPEGDVDA